MVPTLLLLGMLVVVGLVSWWVRREHARRLLQEHTIGPEELHELLSGQLKPRVFDVRQPLELLAYSEVIPGSERIAPKAIQADPTLIPRDEMTVVYCTCPGDEASTQILTKALALGFERMAILRGGLAGWKAKGYSVEPYRQVFHLDTPA